MPETEQIINKETSTNPNGGGTTSSTGSSQSQTSKQASGLDMMLAEIMKQESDSMLKIKEQLLRRVVLESEIKPARIPAPKNITEIGGYINLMRKLKKEEMAQKIELLRLLKEGEAIDSSTYDKMLEQTLTSILGLPVQTPIG